MKRTGWHNVEGRDRRRAAILRRANWTLCDYVAGDEAEILSLCQAVFGSSLTPQEWNWRTFQNPAGRAISLLARDKDTGRLIGHVAGVPIDLKVGRFLRKVFLTVDSAVDPSHQGRGIHAALSMQISDRTDEVEAGFALGLPNEQAYVPMLKLGTTHILTMSVYLKVLDWSRLIQAKFPSNGLTRFAVRLIHPFQRKRKTNVRAFDGPSLQEVHNFGPEVDALWNRIEAQFGICARRTSTILNWRYFDRPNSLYRAFSISSGGQWRGYVVIRLLEKWGLRLGTLVDLFFDPNDVQSGKHLIDQAEVALREQGADLIWALFACPSNYRRLLRRANFFKVFHGLGRPFHLVADFVRTERMHPDLRDRDGALFRQAEQWFLSLGETDLA